MPDREKVIDELIMLKRFIPSTMWEPISDAIELLKEQPEIVRCKDCQNLGYTNSHWFCKWLNRCVDENWLCADGVKRK